ncbi:FA20C-like protein [Mya arenaria]|uniref:FA20C-like protein n=1 Tax=Mya arenaria TaxID=6604 RepID=A0ABY7DFY6_MYAAR|nr:extracellular serine/threonine protein CG31145-like [Mya arenaria]XP_052818430.1 extracellular serine/threonine protein CG31145-like [Mya arenaria]XP_052818436.1 extracellular serine/threonine protein CG31145-like [Mya arenaria]XP_052818441.1 extracellular serine/threonine protein CG31145-like [Mya arenaria]XP_052818448.1 extracellular serine/threonine protein CG31145-like [Mya arenaria]XP_052818451.1 extracellular serine/threonine protein CG31145-like [Mya arenaria]XP_052818459.1 extracel
MWEGTMKLRLRGVLVVCGALSFCAICLTFSRLPIAHERRRPFLPNGHDVKRTFSVDSGEFAHIFTFRKRLNKSNYSSDNISPEMAKRAMEVKANDTNEDLKYQSDSFNNDNLNDTNLRNQRPNLVGSYVKNSQLNLTSELVDRMLNKLQTSNGLKFNFEKTRNVPYRNFLKLQSKRIRRRGMGLPIYENYNGGPVLANWERFHKGIHQFGLYDGDDPAVNGIMDDMANQQIVDIEQKEGGTQLKLIVTFSDEGQALFKPMRHPRDQETLPNHFYFVDFERHNAEIAAFHLDRILGFYRVPPTVGREVNLTHEIKRLAEPSLKKTFFISPANNVCFHGTCSYYCDTSHAVCGRPATLEASLATFLPPERIAPRKTWRNPWKRSYSKHRKAYWESFDDLCGRVQEKEPYTSGRRLLDLIDMHVFDFLTGNMDRHHYETFTDFGNETFLLHLDNGRAFGRSGHDEISILAPLYQCCMIRYSTFLKFVKLYLGPEPLSVLMRTSMARDPIQPILTESHIRALDRRVIRVLSTIHDCMQDNPYTDVIIDDFF